jgi:hypothetical protein
MVFIKRLFRNCGLSIVLMALFPAYQALAADGYYYQIKVYHLKDKTQEDVLDAYLKDAYVPQLHKLGIKNVGVFKSLQTDTAKRIYVFVPFKSLKELNELDLKIFTATSAADANKAYINANYKTPPYTRVETIILSSFREMLAPAVPNLTAPKAERVYELRSYESATEKYYYNKVKMFNDGDEVGLFNRLGFNAVFYASVIAGSKMPNLMYMTTFNNKEDRDKHWAAFSADAYWKELSAKPEYQNNVSHADIIFLHPADYSDF